MNDSELKKLSRADLLQLLLDERRENERLQLKLKETEEKLSERTIAIDEAGSIAQAVMQLNGVFKAAEAAASQYVENVQRLQTEKEAKFWQMEIEAKERAENIIEEAQAYSRRVHSETDKYQTLLAEKLKAMLTEYTHGEECYVDTSAELETFCGKVEHTHAAECFDENGMMICILEEHLHGEECYLDTSDELDTFCGKVEHTHSFECYDDDCALICLLEEHIHTEICYTEKTVEVILGFEPLATAYLVEVNLLEQPLMMSAVQAMPREAGAETDFTNYITKVTLQYNENNSWKDAPADYVIKKGEQVRFKLDYMLPARKLQEENNTIKYQLPDAFKNVDLTGGNVYNGATKIGSFTVSNDNTVHIEFLPTYVESNETGNAIIGDVIIKAEINEGKFDGDKVNIDFGNNLKVEYDFDRSDKDWSMLRLRRQVL